MEKVFLRQLKFSSQDLKKGITAVIIKFSAKRIPVAKDEILFFELDPSNQILYLKENNNRVKSISIKIEVTAEIFTEYELKADLEVLSEPIDNLELVGVRLRWPNPEGRDSIIYGTFILLK